MHDFRAFYHLSWWEQVERGDVEELDLLLAGLKIRPDSLWRATLFTRNPPKRPEGQSTQLGWLGWDQQLALLLEIRNLLAGKSGRLQGPPTSSGEAVQLESEIDVLMQLRRPN